MVHVVCTGHTKREGKEGKGGVRDPPGKIHVFAGDRGRYLSIKTHSHTSDCHPIRVNRRTQSPSPPLQKKSFFWQKLGYNKPLLSGRSCFFFILRVGIILRTQLIQERPMGTRMCFSTIPRRMQMHPSPSSASACLNTRLETLGSTDEMR